jgi:SAV_6107-like HEPN
MTERTHRRTPFGHPPLDLLEQARLGLIQSAMSTRVGDRYIAAHLAALRAGTAVLAARARPRSVQGPCNVWAVLQRIAPELTEWAAFFAATATKRVAIEAGIPRVVTPREADDLLREAEHFVAVVALTLGLPHQDAMPGCVATLSAPASGGS